MKSARLLLWLLIALSLASCASGGPPISRIWGLLFPDESAADTTPLRKDLRYLRVTSAGHVVLMVLGYVDADSKDGDTEVWYSGKGEVLKLRDGRIVQTAGLTTDWTGVRLPILPKWNALSTTPYIYQRERDEMPGYRYGIKETVTLRAIAAPDDSLITGAGPQQLRWYEEAVQAQNASSAPVVAPSRFAVDAGEGRVIYAEQCLSSALCLAWQSWPPAANMAAATSR